MTTLSPLTEKITALAGQVPKDSCIVELGTFHGKGTIALAKGAPEGVEVFTIDDYIEKKGWIGEHYGPEDALIFFENIVEAEVNVTLKKMSIENAARFWIRPIGLLYWDIGIPGRFESDWNDWSPFVIPGGMFIAKDTPSNHLGTFSVIAQAVGQGWEKFDYWKGVSFVRRLE